MPYPDGNPTLTEQLDEDARVRFYTADLVKEGLELGRENDRLRAAVESAFKWLAVSARHDPTCNRVKSRIVPDGAYYSGLCKDYGGRYATDEELEKVPCTCGLADLHNILCQAGSVIDPSPGDGK